MMLSLFYGGHPCHFGALSQVTYHGTEALGHADDFVGAVIRWYEKAANMPPVGPIAKDAS